MPYRVGFRVGHPGARLALLVVLLLLVAAIVTVVVLVVRDRRGRGHVVVGAPRPLGPSEATRILDERFARGEIDDEEYRRRRALLSSG